LHGACIDEESHCNPGAHACSLASTRDYKRRFALIVARRIERNFVRQSHDRFEQTTHFNPRLAVIE
jgi:hypothetical protein